MLLIADRREAYLDYGLPVVEDSVKWKGPLGGIFTGLTYSTSEHSFVMGCDMPFVEPRLIGYMIGREMIWVPTTWVGTQRF
jgi:molybdopterin-guanine dinucleotide biosynthesis protein A